MPSTVPVLTANEAQSLEEPPKVAPVIDAPCDHALAERSFVPAPFTLAVSCAHPLADPPVETASELPSPCAYSLALANDPVTKASSVVAHSLAEPSVGALLPVTEA